MIVYPGLKVRRKDGKTAVCHGRNLDGGRQRVLHGREDPPPALLSLGTHLFTTVGAGRLRLYEVSTAAGANWVTVGVDRQP